MEYIGIVNRLIMAHYRITLDEKPLKKKPAFKVSLVINQCQWSIIHVLQLLRHGIDVNFTSQVEQKESHLKCLKCNFFAVSA